MIRHHGRSRLAEELIALQPRRQQSSLNWSSCRGAQRLGVILPGTMPARGPRGIEDWAGRGAGKKELFARCAEALADHGEFCNHEVRRLVRTVEDCEVMDNTL